MGACSSKPTDPLIRVFVTDMASNTLVKEMTVNPKDPVSRIAKYIRQHLGDEQASLKLVNPAMRVLDDKVKAKDINKHDGAAASNSSGNSDQVLKLEYKVRCTPLSDAEVEGLQPLIKVTLGDPDPSYPELVETRIRISLEPYFPMRQPTPVQFPDGRTWVITSTTTGSSDLPCLYLQSGETFRTASYPEADFGKNNREAGRTFRFKYMPSQALSANGNYWVDPSDLPSKAAIGSKC